MNVIIANIIKLVMVESVKIWLICHFTSYINSIKRRNKWLNVSSNKTTDKHGDCQCETHNLCKEKSEHSDNWMHLLSKPNTITAF